MRKTTVYLDDKELKALKAMAAKRAGTSSARLIREAVQSFLGRKDKKTGFDFLKKALGQKPRPSSFSDPVAYQKSIRQEWS
jgi:hypothetical protein